MRKNSGFTLIELIVVLIIVAIIGSVLVGFVGRGCSSMFLKKEYSGVIENIQVLPPAIATNSVNSGYSFSLRIRTPEGIEMSSSEDRQFATAQVGDSVRVVTFQYAPWNISKQGTYYNTRLLRDYGQARPPSAEQPAQQ